MDLCGDVLCSRHSVVGPDGCTVLDNEASHENYFRTLQFVTSTHVVFFINRGMHQAASSVPFGKMSCSNASIVFFLVFARQGLVGGIVLVGRIQPTASWTTAWLHSGVVCALADDVVERSPHRERAVLYGVRVRVSHHWHFRGFERISFCVHVHIPINVSINLSLVQTVLAEALGLSVGFAELHEIGALRSSRISGASMRPKAAIWRTSQRRIHAVLDRHPRSQRRWFSYDVKSGQMSTEWSSSRAVATESVSGPSGQRPSGRAGTWVCGDFEKYLSAVFMSDARFSTIASPRVSGTWTQTFQPKRGRIGDQETSGVSHQVPPVSVSAHRHRATMLRPRERRGSSSWSCPFACGISSQVGGKATRISTVSTRALQSSSRRPTPKTAQRHLILSAYSVVPDLSEFWASSAAGSSHFFWVCRSLSA